MSTIMRRDPRGLFPELLDWLEAPFASLLPSSAQTIRVEDYVKDGRYVLRAELPDIDPDKDVEITIAGGILTIRAERQEEHKDQYRTEFRYGSFTRSIALPQGADENDVKATYDKGILEISVKIAEPQRASGRRIEIEKP
ncbi:Molecular chaperone IbpA, HSP20 family [Thermostaphylospora chromogena]|uniref:Molecular chaperone IbpA, HSP20 family n=2 Tax=Thermostaphylospora chromogena TaxID=35622 RepID=A0A1H0ZVQ0_9ACTN|nr:Molecular chaperone IbpA, HSP20 family [Thermostaphylospora chromogena]